jgi:hypothetical protein
LDDSEKDGLQIATTKIHPAQSDVVDGAMSSTKVENVE